ncbi:MAG: hypothetical protein ACTS78_03750 [Arsenophonus sp. NC-WZS1-MAG3]
MLLPTYLKYIKGDQELLLCLLYEYPPVISQSSDGALISEKKWFTNGTEAD